MTRCDSEGRLVREASQRDAATLGSPIERHLPRLRACVRLKAGPRVRAKESCSDLVQSVCREVLQGLDRFEYRGEAAFRQWLYTAALRKIIERRRYHQARKRDAAREVPLAAPASTAGEGWLLACYRAVFSPSGEVQARQTLERIELAFDQLPEDYPEVIVMVRILELPHAEIARRMGRGEKAVESLLFRAVARLGTILQEVL